MKLDHLYSLREAYDLLQYREPYEVAHELSQLAKVLVTAGLQESTSFLELGSGPTSKYHSLASATFPFYGLNVKRWLTSDVSGGDYPCNLLNGSIQHAPVDVSLLPYNLIAVLVHDDLSIPTVAELRSVLKNLPGKWAVGLVELAHGRTFSCSFHLYDAHLCRYLGEGPGATATTFLRVVKHPAGFSCSESVRTPNSRVSFERPFIYQWIHALKAINSLGQNHVTWYRFFRGKPRKVRNPKEHGDYWYILDLEGIKNEN